MGLPNGMDRSAATLMAGSLLDNPAAAPVSPHERIGVVLGRIAAAITEPDSLPEAICDAIQRVFGYYLVEIWLIDERSGMLESRASLGPGGLAVRGEMPRLDPGSRRGLIARACREGRVVRADDVRGEPAYISRVALGSKIGSELVVPLSAVGKLYGALNIESDRPATFSDADVSVMATVGTQAAIALRNRELHREEERRRLEAESLRIAAAALNESLDRDEVLRRILEGLSKVVEFDSVSIMLREGEKVVFVSTFGVDEKNVAAKYPPLETMPFIRKLLERREASVVPDVRKDPDWCSVPGDEYIRCWMGVPLISKGDVVGILTLDHRAPGYYGPHHVRLATDFAAQAAVSIENARLYAVEAARRREAEILSDVAAVIGTSLDPSKTLKLILAEIGKVIEYDSLSIMLANGDRLEIVDATWPEGRYGFNRSGDFSELPILKRLMAGSKPLLVPDTLLEPDWVAEAAAGDSYIRSWIGVPLRVGATTIGVLNIDHHVPGRYGPHDLELASSFANHAAIAIRNAQLYERSRREIADRRQAEALSQEAHAEKLEFLSSLVAVIAHEVNTPTGVAITAASHLHTLVDDLRSGYLARTIGEKAFLGALEEGGETVGILETNLQRIAELVRNFRKIAVDQQMDEKRRFNVKEYLDIALLSLKPRLRSLPHRLSFACPADLEADTTPGALYQMIVNFIGNSLMHAFPDGRRGTMLLEVSGKGDTLEIVYSDDGAGIAAEHLESIFKPFFTTARASGGTGLGLYVVSNLAAKLGGSVSCTSAPGEGARFLVQIPGILVSGGRHDE